MKCDRNAELFTPRLQDVEQTKARNAGKAVPVNGNLFAAMNDIDIVPRLKVSSDCRMGNFIGFTQVSERPSRKNNAPTKRIVRSIAFVDRDVVGGVRVFH